MSRDSVFIKHKKDLDTSSAWSHFLIANDGKSARCKRCLAVLKTLGGSTKGLHTHLSSKHNFKVLSESNCSSTGHGHREQLEENSTPPPAKRKLVEYFIKSDTLDHVLARMTALDGFPFIVFITSNDLRQLLISKGYSDLPKSAVTIRNRVVNFSLTIRKEIIDEFKRLKNTGKRFSSTFDEWTSTANKRFMNINVHSQTKFWSLGLIRVHGSITAENCICVLKERLSRFDISLEKDIVAIVTDGPNVMLKVGKLVDTEHQLCFAHCIHLAVCDVLYNKKNIRDESTANDINEDDNEEFDEDDDEEFDFPDSGLNILPQNDIIQDMPDLTNEYNINVVIKKIRKVVMYFKRSPTKNDTILQKYVKAEHGKEIKLLLDCKTRWNSLLAMLERFILLKTSIQKSLIDLNHPVSLEDSDYNLITEITDVLAPIKLTVEAIGHRDSNLCTADAAFKFLFKELSEKNSVLANKMRTCLSDRIKKRRRPELSGVLSYLQNPHDDYDKITYLKDIFLIPKNDFIRKQIIKLIERIHYNEHLMTPNEEEQHCFEQTESESITLTQLTLKEKLELEIGKSKRKFDPITQKETDLIKIIKKEMNLFENGGTRGHHLNLAFKYLMSIPPTSIESERAFSAAAYIGNKLRSRLGDGTLDALLFLRSYFQNN